MSQSENGQFGNPEFEYSELTEMVDRWLEANRRAQEAGDWRPMAELFTVDATYGWNMGPHEDFMAVGRDEIREVEEGRMPRDGNVLKRAPHTMESLAANDWDRPYTREQAAFPAPVLRQRKAWPTVSRIDNAFGDRNLVCTCPPVEAYLE